MGTDTFATLLVTAGTAGVVTGVGARTTDDRDAAPHVAGERAAASSPVDGDGHVDDEHADGGASVRPGR